MDKCPFSGDHCPHRKVIHITEIKDYKAVGEAHCCHKCGEDFMKPEESPPPGEPTKIPTQAVTLFEILKNLIHNKFSQIPQEVVLTNYSPEAFQPKPPCPSCGASLQDIAKAQRLGCPGCYDHYNKELLPVLIHAHKCCEHVGKVPKNRKIPLGDPIKTLELRLKQAIEQERYERAREIKNEIDRLKNQ